MGDTLDEISDKMAVELEAAAFRRLVEHFDNHKDVQNIDLMNLAGFCRNCLSKWYLAAAKERKIDLDFDAARKIIYGMPYSDWKKSYQSESSMEQQEMYEKTKPLHAKITGHQ